MCHPRNCAPHINLSGGKLTGQLATLPPASRTRSCTKACMSGGKHASGNVLNCVLEYSSSHTLGNCHNSLTAIHGSVVVPASEVMVNEDSSARNVARGVL